MPALQIDASIDVNTDVDGREATVLTITSPPEAEGATMGCNYFDDISSAVSAGGGDEDLGTLASQDADNVQITGGELSGVTLTNVTVDGGWF